MTISEDEYDHYDYDREDRLDTSTTITDVVIFNNFILKSRL